MLTERSIIVNRAGLYLLPPGLKQQGLKLWPDVLQRDIDICNLDYTESVGSPLKDGIQRDRGGATWGRTHLANSEPSCDQHDFDIAMSRLCASHGTEEDREKRTYEHWVPALQRPKSSTCVPSSFQKRPWQLKQEQRTNAERSVGLACCKYRANISSIMA